MSSLKFSVQVCDRFLITALGAPALIQLDSSVRASRRKGGSRLHRDHEAPWSNLQSENLEDSEFLFPSNPTIYSSRLSSGADRDEEMLGPDAIGTAASRSNHVDRQRTHGLVESSQPGRSQSQNEKSYLGDSGFMPIFAQASRDGGHSTSLANTLDQTIPEISTLLRQSFAETYIEYCFPWCPVLDRDSLFDDEVFSQSLLLQQALGLLGSIIHPPIIPHPSPQTYYTQMKKLFYANHENNPLVRIVSIIIIHWWSACPPNVVSMESSYFWTSIAIRLAQEIGLHREIAATHVFRPGESRGLRRRIWWTLFVSSPALNCFPINPILG